MNQSVLDQTGYTAEHALFTEAEYGRLLDMAVSKYAFCGYDDEPGRPFVIWRHDVDYSPHRALALAKIEAQRKVRCIYHVLLGSRYYNVFEPEIAAIFREIASLGHEVGLHFDMDAFGENSDASDTDFDERIRLERAVIEALLGITLRSLSFHNFHMNRARLRQQEKICGLTNASMSRLSTDFKYVSDSNGIWRYDRLQDVLAREAFPRLHVLTHPEWWTMEPMPPVERLRRVIGGRADANFHIYAHQLRRDGRLASIGERIGFSHDYVAAAIADAKPRGG